ncbi:MAG: hypothetical protein ACRD18_12160 [Terriglobia bacterium]
MIRKLSTQFPVVPCLILLAIIPPCAATAQDVAQQALSAFPSDTQQIAYVNLAQLRTLPNYRQLHGVLLNRQMHLFEDFLRSIGSDPDKEVDEAVVGLRSAGDQPLFGLASGQFNPSQAQNFIVREKLPTRQYAGFTLDAFGPGLSADDLFFTFINPGLAAFGRLSDLEAVLDGYLGQRATLSSNRRFVNWEATLDGSGPEWGITTGKAAINLAAPWLLDNSKPSGSKLKLDLSSVLGPIKAVLYQANWDNGFSAQITAICQNAQSAQTLSRLLSIWRDSASFTGPHAPDVSNFIQSLQIEASGSQVEISGSGSPGAFTRLLQNASER